VRPESHHVRGDVERFVGARSPISSQCDTRPVGTAAQPVDAIVSVRSFVGLESMPAAESKSPILRQPSPQPMGCEGGKIRVLRRPRSPGPRPQRPGLRVLPPDCEEGGTRQTTEILKVSAWVGRRHVRGACGGLLLRHRTRPPVHPTTAAISFAPSPFASARAKALAAPRIMSAGAPNDWASAAA
jgi:hypothetical protein